MPFEPSSLLTLDKMLEPGALIPPKINFKPSWTLADIDRLCKVPVRKDCLRLPTGEKPTKMARDNVPGEK